MLLYLNSRDRYSGASTSDFSVRLPTTYKDVKSVRLQSVYIPNTIYNITAANNTLPVIFYHEEVVDLETVIVGTTYTATIPPAKYSSGSLATALKSALETATAATSTTFTVTIDTSTFLCTIANNNSCALDFSGSGSPYLELGFTQALTTDALTHTGTKCVQLNQPTSIFIRVREWNHRGIHVTGTSSYNPSFIVPLANNPGDVSQFTTRNDFEQKIDLPDVTFATLNVQVTDNNNNVIDLVGAEWSAIFDIC